jgi:hypothetical protein
MLFINSFLLKKTNENKNSTAIAMLLKANEIGMLKATKNNTTSSSNCVLF